MECNNCGLKFDTSDLEQVFYHEHKNLTLFIKPSKSKRVINDASDVYPNCSRQFACGVHTWINEGNNYDQRCLYQESQEFRQGFYQAMGQLADNYKIKR